MYRRNFIHWLLGLPAVAVSVRMDMSSNINPAPCGVRDSDIERMISLPPHSPHKLPLRVGLFGVVGQGVFQLDAVAKALDHPAKEVAIETNVERLRWCEAASSILISTHGSGWTTVRDVEAMARDRKAEILQLANGLDISFLLTGLNGTSGRGVTAVVGETLAECGVFTVAISPRRQSAEGINSLRSVADIVFQISDEVLMGEARRSRRHGWFDHYLTTLVPAALAQVCRVVIRVVGRAESRGLTTKHLRWLLRGNGFAAIGYAHGDGANGHVAALRAARASPLLDRDRLRQSSALMVCIEAKHGTVTQEDLHVVHEETRTIARNGARIQLCAFDNARIESDYRVTILSRG